MTTLVRDNTALVTGEAFLRMGDVGPCELIEGRIIWMSPTSFEHSVVEFNIGRLLGNFVAKSKIGWVIGGEIGIYIRRHPDTIRAADVGFISKARMAKRPRRGFLEVAPELVIVWREQSEAMQGHRPAPTRPERGRTVGGNENRKGMEL